MSPLSSTWEHNDKIGNEENDRPFRGWDEKHPFPFTQTLALPVAIASQGSGQRAPPHFTGEDWPGADSFCQLGQAFMEQFWALTWLCRHWWLMGQRWPGSQTHRIYCPRGRLPVLCMKPAFLGRWNKVPQVMYLACRPVKNKQTQKGTDDDDEAETQVTVILSHGASILRPWAGPWAKHSTLIASFHLHGGTGRRVQ